MAPSTWSIDHIQPWLHNDNLLFWDLNNVSFSHKKCNKPHVYKGGVKKKIGPEGTAWCAKCKQFKNVELFNSNKSRWNKLSSDCRICANLKTRRGR